MMAQKSLPAIPWAHSAAEFGAIWHWRTPHFDVMVNGSNRSCYYVISSINADGALEPFADGSTAHFAEAELLIRETVGKAYSKALGYQHYADYLATTFTISTNEKIDFAPYIGKLLNLNIYIRDEASGEVTEETLKGKITVEYYDIIFEGEGKVLRISPTFIKAISLARIAEPPKNNANYLDRIVNGTVVPGCTGRLGAFLGIVEHYGPLCPIHEKLSSST